MEFQTRLQRVVMGLASFVKVYRILTIFATNVDRSF